MKDKKAFDQYVEYYNPVRTADTYGQVKETYELYQKAFVSVERYQGGEQVVAERVQFSGIYAFLGHYITGVDVTFRIKYEDEYYAIVDIEPIDRKRWMRLRVEKIID